MTKTKIIVISILLGISYLFYASIEQNKLEKQKSKLEQEALNEKNKIRFEKGAFVINENRLSDDEITKTIIYPGKDGDWYDEIFDSTCLVYINNKLNQTKMNCSGILFDKTNENDGADNDVEPEQSYGRY